MEFGIKKSAMQKLKSGKRQITEGIELLHQEKIRSLRENKNYKYLWVLEADNIEEVEMKEKI